MRFGAVNDSQLKILIERGARDRLPHGGGHLDWGLLQHQR
jgi:hypothetical protein